MKAASRGAGRSRRGGGCFGWFWKGALALLIVGFVIAIVESNQQEAEFEQNRDAILQETRAALAAGDLDRLEAIEEKYRYVTDDEFERLIDEANRLREQRE